MSFFPLNIIFKNFFYKVFAVILAFIFWYIIQGEEVLEINRKIQVITQPPPGFVIKGGNVRYKDATLKGPRAVLSHFSSRPIEAKIKISTNKPGKLKYRIDKQYIYNWDNRINLTIHDAYLSLFIDEQLTKRIPIKEYLQGLPAEGYMIEKTTVTPPNIVITGLKSETTLLQQIMTEPIDISGIQKSRWFETSLKTKDLEASLSTEKVKVSIQVGEKKINRRFDQIPIEIKKSKGVSITARTKFVSIVVQGTPGIFSFIKQSDLRAFLDLTELSPGKYEKKIQVKIPPDTILIETVPANAIVEIK